MTVGHGDMSFAYIQMVVLGVDGEPQYSSSWAEAESQTLVSPHSFPGPCLPGCQVDDQCSLHMGPDGRKLGSLVPMPDSQDCLAARTPSQRLRPAFTQADDDDNENNTLGSPR